MVNSLFRWQLRLIMYLPRRHLFRCDKVLPLGLVLPICNHSWVHARRGPRWYIILRNHVNIVALTRLHVIKFTSGTLFGEISEVYHLILRSRLLLNFHLIKVKPLNLLWIWETSMMIDPTSSVRCAFILDVDISRCQDVICHTAWLVRGPHLFRIWRQCHRQSGC